LSALAGLFFVTVQQEGLRSIHIPVLFGFDLQRPWVEVDLSLDRLEVHESAYASMQDKKRKTGYTLFSSHCPSSRCLARLPACTKEKGKKLQRANRANKTACLSAQQNGSKVQCLFFFSLLL